MQTVRALIKVDRSGRSEERDTLDAAVTSNTERVNNGFPALLRPREFDGVERPSFGGEAKVVLRVSVGVDIMEGACSNPGWTFTEDSPRTCAIDCFSVDVKPIADLEQHLLHLIRDRAVRAGSDIHEQITVFADDIDELMHDEFRRFERIVFDVAPRLVADRRIRLPRLLAYLGELPPLDVKDAGALLHSVELVVDDTDRSVLLRLVVVEGRELCQVWPDGGLSDPPVEVHDVGMILFDDLRGTCEPVIQVGIARVGEITRQLIVARLEAAMCGVIEIGWLFPSTFEEPVVLDAVGGCAEVKSLCPDGPTEITYEVSVRSHLGRCPIG